MPIRAAVTLQYTVSFCLCSSQQARHMPFGMSVPQSMILSRTVAKGSLVAKAVATLRVVRRVRFRRSADLVVAVQLLPCYGAVTCAKHCAVSSLPISNNQLHVPLPPHTHCTRCPPSPSREDLPCCDCACTCTCAQHSVERPVRATRSARSVRRQD